jgi:transglutaminase-like putative cysteine protease
MQDEFLESLTGSYDHDALTGADRGTYVLHQTVAYEYAAPVRDLRQRLMVVPRARHGDQQRVVHRFDVNTCGNKRVRTRADRYGNSIVRVSVPAVEERIEFRTRAVLIRDRTAVHPAPWAAAVPTRTRLTAPDAAIHDAARSLGPVRDVLETADAISDLIRSSFEYAHGATSVRTTASAAWQVRRGVCQDMAHVMLALCHLVGLPARYVSGHLIGQGGTHAWVEVVVPRARDAIAVPFDPCHGRRAGSAYVTVAAGRDYSDVAPTSGSYVGRSASRLTAERRVGVLAAA